jgi:hypothetical protein
MRDQAGDVGGRPARLRRAVNSAQAVQRE